MAFETISTIGLGYIGLPTAAAFASCQKKVIGVDIDQNAVDTINQGRIHIVEPGLDDIVKTAVSLGYLRATTTPEPADAFLIAVPTPFKSDHEPDVGYVEAAVRSLAPVLKLGDLVILESTSPVGTTEDMAKWLAEMRPDLSFPQQIGEAADINIAYCPERVLPGKIMQELVSNSRVIGGLSSRCSERAIELYKTFVKGECIATISRTAEMCKLTENSFRDVNIAFANELSVICDKLDINVWKLIKLANRHPRVGILQPGPGVGGHCIAVDPWFIISKTPEEARLIKTAREVNESKPEWVISKVQLAIEQLLQENPQKVTKDIAIACYGITFKSDIDDIRESPSLDISQKLAHHFDSNILIIEPNIEKLPLELLKYENIKKCSPAKAAKEADIHILLVDHKEFKEINTLTFNNYNIIDTKGVWLQNMK